MADLAAGDVTYTERAGTKSRFGCTRLLTRNKVRVQFGDGAKTYPTGGVPLTVGKLGLTTEVQSIEVSINAAAAGQPAWVWNGSTTAPKLVGYEVDATAAGDTGLVELDNADTPAAQDLELVVVGY